MQPEVGQAGVRGLYVLSCEAGVRGGSGGGGGGHSAA